MYKLLLYVLTYFSLAIVFWKVQIVTTKVIWLYQYGHYFCSLMYLDDMASNVFFFTNYPLSFELNLQKK